MAKYMPVSPDGPRGEKVSHCRWTQPALSGYSFFDIHGPDLEQAMERMAWFAEEVWPTSEDPTWSPLSKMGYKGVAKGTHCCP